MNEVKNSKSYARSTKQILITKAQMTKKIKVLNI